MLVEEAKAIGGILQQRIAAGRSNDLILNIGSSTKHFRTEVQPHISQFAFPETVLEDSSIIHVDIKQDDGVDLVGDILDNGFRKQVQKLNADLIVCANVLEHVSNPASFALALSDLSKVADILVSCPKSYPFHPDPIDNGFRPSVEELLALFPNYRLLSGEVVKAGNFGDRFRKMSLSTKLRFLVSTLRRTQKKNTVSSELKFGYPGDHLNFWRRHFEATVVLLSKNEMDS